MIESLMSSPVVVIVAVVLLAAIVFSLIKKVIKLFIFLLLVFVGYLAYLHFTGQGLPDPKEEVKEKVMEELKKP